MVGAITLIPLWVRVFKPKFALESHIDDADTIRDRELAAASSVLGAKTAAGGVE